MVFGRHIMLFDSHAHLDIRDFDDDRAAVIDRAFSGGVTHILTIGIDLDSSLRALELARTHHLIYASVGFHPHDASAFNPHELDILAQVASDEKIVAWGEIGLDFYRLYSSKDDQLNAFQQQLEMADDLNLPVVIHDRNAHVEVYETLKKMGKGKRKGVIHCFSGDRDLAAAYIEMGYYISIPGTVTYKKASLVRDVAATIPLERLLIETDAPFLTPVPKRGKRNEPLFVTYTAQEIACLRNMDLEELARKTTENAQILFGL